MKNLFITFLLVIFMVSCTVFIPDDINDYNGHIILSMEYDTSNSIGWCDIEIISPNGEYKRITITDEKANLFEVGDTIGVYKKN